MAVMDSGSSQMVRLFALPSQVLRSGHGINWLSYVGLDEQVKASEFRNPEDALHYAAQHALMRAIAASALGIRPTSAAEIELDRTCPYCSAEIEHGKPTIQGVNFIMARTANLAVGAYLSAHTRDGKTEKLDVANLRTVELGVDVERFRGNLLEGYDGVSLTAEETVFLEKLPPQEAQFLRLLLWIGKQAVLKASGRGLPAGLKNVHFELANFSRMVAEEANGVLSDASLSENLGIARVRLPTSDDSLEQKYFLRWVKHEEYFIAVAATELFEVDLRQVTTPLEIKRLLEPR